MFLRGYRLGSLVKLSIDVLRTRLLFPRYRLLRSPYQLRGHNYARIGAGFTTGAGARIDCLKLAERPPELRIGQNCQLNDNVHIGCAESITIGEDVLIASCVFITDHNHGEIDDVEDFLKKPIERKLQCKPVVIEDRVWLGEGVIVLPGVTIGEGSVVGGGSVVTKDLPPYSISVGAPAKPIRVLDVDTKVWISQ